VSTPTGHHEDRVWAANPGAYGGRTARRGGAYRVFIPDSIAQREFEFDGEAAAGLTEAARALANLNGSLSRATTLESLAINLLRSESAASSRIEGLSVSHRRLARAAYLGDGIKGGDARAAEVLGNVNALKQAIEIGERADGFEVDDVKQIHRTLLRFTVDREIAGIVRDSQNWIGGNDFNPVGATYVPPPPEFVDPLLSDLCEFINRRDLPPIAQAAIAHSQFENIHPFADGNGRVGRALIYTILKRGGETGQFIPPISLVLASETRSYIGGIAAFSAGRISEWTELFADATKRATDQAEEFSRRLEQCEVDWRSSIGNPRRDAVIYDILQALPVQPIIDVGTIQHLTGKSHVAIGAAISKLEGVGILKPLHERAWGRAWECADLFDLLTNFERGVRSA
jgi:Fic family protein